MARLCARPGWPDTGSSSSQNAAEQRPLLDLQVVPSLSCVWFFVTPYFLLKHASPLWWKGHFFFFFFGVSSRRSWRSSQNGWTSTSSALAAMAQTWITVMLNAFLRNEQRSFCHFWDCISDCISDSSVDCEGCSTSSKGFLLTVVDIMVPWLGSIDANFSFPSFYHFILIYFILTYP